MLHKILEQVVRVVRAGRGLGVILHAEQRQRAVAQALQRVVVQVDVRQVDFALLQRVGIDGEVVIVRGDLDLAGLHLLHRMIAAVMSELQLVSLAAQRQPDQLMPQTDSEDRNLAHQIANTFLRVSDRLGIAGPVGEKHAVRLQREHIFRAGSGRHNCHPAAFAHQTAKNVVLDPIVIGDHMMFRRRVFHADNLCRLVRAHTLIPLIDVARGDFLRQVRAIHLGDRARLRDQLLGVDLQRRDDSAHDSVVAQMPNQGARVDLAQHRNLVALQIFFRNFLRAPVRADPRELAHDQAFDIRPRGFVVVRVGAVIADFRIGENYDLSGVGGVGEDFLIARDGGVKNNFPVTFTFCSVAFAVEDPSIFQRKDCLHCISGEWILMILSGNARQHKRRRQEFAQCTSCRAETSASSLIRWLLLIRNARPFSLLTLHRLVRTKQRRLGGRRVRRLLLVAGRSGRGIRGSFLCRRS